jgi:hypothetical protein
MSETKISVLIVNEKIGNAGLLTNAALVLGLTAGTVLPPETFGGDVTDGDGKVHRRLTAIGHHVRKATPGKLHALRAALAANPDVIVVDYTEDAAPSSYEAYVQSLGSHAGDAIVYRAVYVYGPESVVGPATKNLSRLS